MTYLGSWRQPTLVILVLTSWPMTIRDTVAAEASLRVLLHQTEGIIEAGVVLALLHPVLAHPPRPGEGAHAEEVPHQVHAVTIIKTGVLLTLVNVDLARCASPALSADTREGVTEAVHTFATITASHPSVVQASGHVTHLDTKFME